MKHLFAETPVLSNHRLVLRGLGAADVPSIVELSFYDGIPARSEAEALVMFERIAADCAQGESVHWGICLKSTGEVVGTCGFYRGFPEGIGEVGYVLKEAYRGQGIMTEAVRLVVAFGLTEMGLRRIVASTERTNLASVAVLKRVGFEPVVSESEYLEFAIAPP